MNLKAFEQKKKKEKKLSTNEKTHYEVAKKKKIAIHATDKGLLSKTYKQLMQLNI